MLHERPDQPTAQAGQHYREHRMGSRDLTHASFFSGVGGLDLGLERAGWRTVSFSEIDPYASAVLAERWPGVPNLGDITTLQRCYDDNGDRLHDPLCRLSDGECRNGVPEHGRESQSGRGAAESSAAGGEWTRAVLWTGGFPCQDLSVAGKRRGMGTDGDRTRSGLAYAFLDLVERHRPPSILLENVPGLLSSNGGRDFGALLRQMGELGYWWAYRILDAQFFGVPQRRRRVFICALHAGAGFGADSPAAVLSVGSRCGGHSATGDEAGEGTTGRSVVSAFSPVRGGPDDNDAQAGHLISTASDSGGVREADELAGRLDGSEVVAFSGSGGQRTTDLNTPLVYRKSARVNSPDSPETWVDDGLSNTLNAFDVGDIRTTHIAIGGEAADSDLLPLGLDSHRYRCCGNGVVSNVSEWIGHRLAVAVNEMEAAA